MQSPLLRRITLVTMCCDFFKLFLYFLLFIAFNFLIHRYLCNLPEEEFRLSNARAMADLMLNTVKVQIDNSPKLDKYVLFALYFHCFPMCKLQRCSLLKQMRYQNIEDTGSQVCINIVLYMLSTLSNVSVLFSNCSFLYFIK